MHVTVKHLFVLLVAAMGIVVAVEIINYEYGLEYRKAASIERLTLKNIISNNDDKITLLAKAELQVLNRLYFLVNSTENSDMQRAENLVNLNSSHQTIIHELRGLENILNASDNPDIPNIIINRTSN